MPNTKESGKFPTEAEQAAWWAGYSTSEQAVERLIEALREACPECKTPEQSGMRNGYSCPAHRVLIIEARRPE